MAGVNTSLSGLAGRYATALLAVAEERSALDAVAEDLKGLLALIEGNAGLSRLLDSPRYPGEQQAKALDAILGGFGADKITRNFVMVVTKNRRLAALAEIASTCLAELSRRRGEVRAKITVAQELTKIQQKAIVDALSGSVGDSVKLDVNLDDSLIGGMIIQIGSQMLDGSVRTKLQRLEMLMKGVG